MVELMKELDEEGAPIDQNRSYVMSEIVREFERCHECLLLAVYGLYKNGYIKGTDRRQTDKTDFRGFNGAYSLDIQHAFDALKILQENPSLTGSAIKKELGGEASIYSFVRYFYVNDLLDVK